LLNRFRPYAGEVTYLRKFVHLLVAFALFVLTASPLAAGQSVSLTILHTNDTHGHLQPFSYPDAAVGGPELQGLRVYRNVGGIARRATLVKKIRRELETRGVAVWLVDVGDYSDGTPFSIEYHGEADVAAMNAVGYDLGTLGNHEFNNSIEQLLKLIGQTRYKLVCANTKIRATGAPLVDPSVIRTVGDLRVGVFGLLTHESATYRAGKEGIVVEDEIEAARRMVAELRPKADVIVMLSHAGREVDERIGAEVPGIDVIVGGHSHSRLPSGELVWRSEDLKMSDVNATVIVQAHQWGGEVGRLDLLFARDDTGAWHVDRYRSRLLPVTSDIPEDETVAAVVSRFWKPIATRYGEVIGIAAGEFSSRGDDLAEYNLADDAVREATGTEIVMQNLGGVRAPLLRGDITRGDLVTLDPFLNTVVTFRATGRDIIRILKRYAPSVSGIRYRIVNGELVEATIGGKAIDENRIYSGASNSYFAAFALKGLAVEDTGKVRVDVLIDYIRRKGTVTPALDSRRVVVSR
jgi:5'-nucleotidase